MKIFLCIVFCLLLILGCEETLPQRSDPNYLFISSFRINSFADETGQSYAEIFLTVKNSYDETLQGIAVLEGKIFIELKPQAVRDYNYHRTLVLTENDLSFARRYNRVTKQLTIDHGDSIVFYKRWDLKNDEYLWMLANEKFQDDDCFVWRVEETSPAPRQISEPQNILISASLKLFEKAAYLSPKQANVYLCFMVAHNGEYKPCEVIKGKDPCSFLKK